MEAILFLAVGTLIGVFGARLLGAAVARLGPWAVLWAFALLVAAFAVAQGRPWLTLLGLVAPASFWLFERWRRGYEARLRAREVPPPS